MATVPATTSPPVGNAADAIAHAAGVNKAQASAKDNGVRLPRNAAVCHGPCAAAAGLARLILALPAEKNDFGHHHKLLKNVVLDHFAGVVQWGFPFDLTGLIY